MNLIQRYKNTNYLGEFLDKSLESEFFKQDMQKAMWFLRPAALMLGILNTLFIIPDYFLIHSRNSLLMVSSGRILFIVLIAAFFIKTKRLEDNRILAYWVTVLEMTGVLVFLFVLYQYQTPNYLIQAFGVMVIILSVYMIPNRWINMIIVSLFISTSFIVLSACYIKDIKMSEFLAGAVYIFIVIFLCSIMAFKNQYYKRVEYVSNKELLRLSTTDHLSGAYNRVKLNDELNQWVAYAKRNKVPLSLVFFDFDNFKKINDTYGHLAGDNVISECADIIRSSIRKTDIFARWGGEEFIILFPNTDAVNTVDLIERIRRIIESHIFNEVRNVTCSFGVAQLSAEDDIKTFLHKADQMLYEAKFAGKNTIKTYTPGE